MPTLTTELVRHLIRMEKPAQREAFGIIRSFLARETGLPVANLYDFINGVDAPHLTGIDRAELLNTVLRALRDGELSNLQKD